jgi:FMN phosphatase YigB (HAD superfamily)
MSLLYFRPPTSDPAGCCRLARYTEGFMSYRAIFFDLGNVLAPFDFTRAFSAMEASSPLTIDEMLQRLQSVSLIHDYECGRVTDREFVQGMRETLELDVDFDEFDVIWNSIFLPPTLVPETLLAELRERYPLLLLSNTNGLHFRFLQKNYPHIGYFHHLVLSHEVGAEKPDPAIYLRALDTVGLSPAEVFFTDDLQANIDAARALGIDAEQFVGVPELEEHLRKRGILPSS